MLARSAKRLLCLCVCLVATTMLPDPAQAVSVGDRVVAATLATVRGNASASASVTGTQPPGRLGTAVASRSSGSTQWWQVNFETGADGWVMASQLAGAYFPPPESRGGWRSLVPHESTPSAAQKAEARAKGGVDWDKLQRAHQYSHGFAGDDAVLVIRNGYVVGDWGRRDAYGVASVSKSLTGLTMAKLFDLAAAGRIARGIRPDEEVHELLPASWGAADADRRKVKIWHLLTMTSGLAPDDMPNRPGYADYILRQPMQHTPGTSWSYASLPVDLLSIAVQRTTGRTLRELFNTHVAAPIGVPAVQWGTFGTYTGASSRAALKARDLARLGYLVMMNGRWGTSGSQFSVISAGRAHQLHEECCATSAAFRKTANSPFPVHSTSPTHYGELWWTNRLHAGLGRSVPADAFYAHGYRETLLVVVPSLNLVVVRYGPKPVAMASFRSEFMSRVMAAVIR
ncbi:MAG: serine hydrolase domain-containing protein [Geminicoccaceae bacterium]